MIPWFIWILIICTPLVIIFRIIYDRIDNQKIKKWNKECDDHRLNLKEKTLPKGYEQQNNKEV